MCENVARKSEGQRLLERQSCRWVERRGMDLSGTKEVPETGYYEKSNEGDFRLPQRFNEICALLGYYASSSGKTLLTFRDNLWVTSSRDVMTLEDGTETLSRNVGKGLPLDAA